MEETKDIKFIFDDEVDENNYDDEAKSPLLANMALQMQRLQSSFDRVTTRLEENDRRWEEGEKRWDEGDRRHEETTEKVAMLWKAMNSTNS